MAMSNFSSVVHRIDNSKIIDNYAFWWNNYENNEELNFIKFITCHSEIFQLISILNSVHVVGEWGIPYLYGSKNNRDRLRWLHSPPIQWYRGCFTNCTLYSTYISKDSVSMPYFLHQNEYYINKLNQ